MSRLSQSRRVVLKSNSCLAREHILRSQRHKPGRSDAKGEREVLADIDREAETSKGRMQLFGHAAHRGIQTRSEEKINLFVSLSVDKNASLFLGPRSGIRLYRDM